MTVATEAKVAIRPTGNRVLVRRDEPERQRGGIILPENSKEKVTTGTILAVGPGTYNAQHRTYIPMELNEGDRVMFDKYGGVAVNIHDDKLLILTDSEIVAKLD